MEYLIYLLIGAGYSLKCYERDPGEYFFSILAGLVWPMAVGVYIANLKDVK